MVQDAVFKIQVLTKAKEAVEVEVEVEVKSLQATIKFNENYTNKLKLELALLRCIRFGIKSETLITSQWRLFEELHNIKVAIIEQAIVQLSHSNPTADAQKKESTIRQDNGRQVLPSNLPRID